MPTWETDVQEVPISSLRPHPLHSEIYGEPVDNPALEVIGESMKRSGFYPDKSILRTHDGRIVDGRTRCHLWKSLKNTTIRCITLPAETSELEIEERVIMGNSYRTKTELQVAMELRKLVAIQAALARQRMGAGSDGGPSKSTDRVAEKVSTPRKKISGKTVGRKIKVLEAIEEAGRRGQRRKAERLTTLLNSGQTVKALEVIAGKKTEEKPKKVEAPPTLHGRATRAYSEFFEACCKATCKGELDVLWATIKRMSKDFRTAEDRVKAGKPAAGLETEEE